MVTTYIDIYGRSYRTIYLNIYRYIYIYIYITQLFIIIIYPGFQDLCAHALVCCVFSNFYKRSAEIWEETGLTGTEQ